MEHVRSLADEGERKIAWVSEWMPVLNGVCDRLRAEGSVEGRRVAVILPVEPKTAYLAASLAAAGAEVTVAFQGVMVHDDVAAGQRALLWADQVHGLRSACLRYFNAAGADPEGHLGEDHDPETHLIPLAIEAAVGAGELQIFGTDYPVETHEDGLALVSMLKVTQADKEKILWRNASRLYSI